MLLLEPRPTVGKTKWGDLVLKMCTYIQKNLFKISFGLMAIIIHLQKLVLSRPSYIYYISSNYC